MLRCLWYCKSTIFQANHNHYHGVLSFDNDVCDTAKVRFFKQITTKGIIQSPFSWCLWYCKSTIFQANHNTMLHMFEELGDVCDTAKVRFFKQITTHYYCSESQETMFVILQKYDFSSKSQRVCAPISLIYDVCDTAKVRFFKQITTPINKLFWNIVMFVILQKYDFSSKSQHAKIR